MPERLPDPSAEPLGAVLPPRPALPRRAPFGFELPQESGELWVVRHGESTWNALGRYQGQADVPLSEQGRWQAAALAQRLAGQEFAAVYSSDLVRAQETARAVAECLQGQPPVCPEFRLREIQVGELAGLTGAEIAQRFPDYLAALRRDPWHTPRPGGESMADLYARSAPAFEAIARRHAGERVLVVTHGGLVRVAVGLVLGEHSAREVWSRLSVSNASITRVLLGGPHCALLGFNDDAHLEALLETREHCNAGGPVT